MSVEVGDTYKNRIGHSVTIISEDIPFNGLRVFIDQFGRSYFEDGKYFYADCNYSLVLNSEEN